MIQILLNISKKLLQEIKKLWTSPPSPCIDMVRVKNERVRGAMKDKMWAGFLGRAVSDGELAEINEIITSCRGF